MKQFPFIVAAAFVLLTSCQTARKTTAVLPSFPEEETSPSESTVYHGSATRINDLVHTKLEIKFDWQKKQLNGKATITLHPHFYPTDSLTLDARGMDIHTVALFNGDERIRLKYDYTDSLNLRIKLDRKYNKNENYTVYIEYTSKPEDLKTHGSIAITSDKGLYFINADGKDKNKPKEIWTLGETQSNCVWMPTIDRPNQKMTQEIYMTVDTQYVTLSNGLLLSSTANGDGTRTDYWKQSLPAAPYLTVIVVGDFAVVKDHWRNIDVNYYVEHEYEKYAKMTFGHTPEMLEFFSTILGVDYPWEKFSQVCVRDFVSGAEENTGAVVHGDFVQQDSGEYIDGSYEQYICHELFHHWFGDYVTTESWANTTLNEGFATYGEYLWFEHKFGRDEADMHGHSDLVSYRLQAREKDHNLIYYTYGEAEEVFDGVSYQKGGRVLHMLRKYMGDEAFFSALKLYLTTNKFSTVEAAQLRLAFEQVTGEDLHWFFNEWFFNKGYPVIAIDYAYNDSLKQQTVTIRQQQNLKTAPLFRLPLDVDVYTSGKATRQRILVTKEDETFRIPVSSKPNLVNVDAEKQLLCVKADNHSRDEFIYMFYHAPLYMDRSEALIKVGDDYQKNTPSAKLVQDALNDKFWNIRNKAIGFIGVLATAAETKDEIKSKLMTMASSDEKSDVRASAIKALSKYYTGEDVKAFFIKVTKDPSYDVMAVALNAIAEKDTAKAFEIAKLMALNAKSGALAAIADIYANNGTEEQSSFFDSAFTKVKEHDYYSLIQTYGVYLAHCNNPVFRKGSDKLLDLAENAQPWSSRLAAMGALDQLVSVLDNRISKLQAEVNRDQKSNMSVSALQADMGQLESQKKLLKQSMDAIKQKETDKNLVKAYKLMAN